MVKFISWDKEANIDSRKVFDSLSGVWKGEILKNGETYKEYEERSEFDLDFKMASDIQQLRAIEKMKYLV